jgi:hypothetical protein
MFNNMFGGKEKGSFLTREDILNADDIVTKEITVPESVPVWGGRKLLIKQLTRGQQDEYEKRQFGGMKIIQEMTDKRKTGKEATQEITGVSTYGNETWLFVQGVCDQNKRQMFKPDEAALLKEKSGEFIDWVATEILIHSGMDKDVRDLADQIKNSSQTPPESSNGG